MTHVKNELVDLAGWPDLDETQLVSVLPSYAKARALIWSTVTLTSGLAFAVPLAAIEMWLSLIHI